LYIVISVVQNRIFHSQNKIKNVSMLKLHFYAQFVITPTCWFLLRELTVNAITRITLRSYCSCFIKSMGQKQ